MRWMLSLLLILPAYALQAQQQVDTLPNPYRRAANTRSEKLYFVPGTGAVETQTGKVILRPGMRMLAGDEDVPEVELPPAFFDLIDTTTARQASGMHFFYSICTFNAKGQLLYHPQWFDNGPDYWVEGRRRFIENEKMGLVNRLGQRIVPARDYSFISPMHNGYALGCRDCRYTVFDSADTEHGTGYSGVRYDVLDAQGKVLFRLDSDPPEGSLDSLRRHYKNAAVVKKLQKILTALPETASAAASMHISADSCHYVCYDEPGPSSPWYHFGLEDTAGLYLGPMVQFLISADGRKIEQINRDLDRTLPYAIWRRQPEKWN